MVRGSALGLILLPLFFGCGSEVKVGTFNSAPAAIITSPADGSSAVAGANVVLVGTVSDPDGAFQSLEVTWTRDGDTVCSDATPDEVGKTSCTTSFSEDGGTATLQVRDQAGGTAADTILLSVIADASPSAVIVAPVESGQFYSDQLITFEGLLSDPEDAPELLTGVWESSLDGVLALDQSPDTTGALLDFTTLSQGEHALVLTATDTLENSASDSITILVGPPNTVPSCEIVAPVSGSAGEVGDLVQFEGEVGDPDITASLIDVEWTSDKDGLLGSSTATSAGEVLFLFNGLSPDAHVITLTVTDEVGGVCTDLISYTVGTSPSITLSSPSIGDSFKLGQFVSFAAEVSDPDEAFTKLELVWESSVDGLISTQGADSTGSAQFVDDTLSEGTHALTVTVTDSTGLYASKIVTFEVVANGLPSISSVSVSPDPAVVDDTLICSYGGFNDADGDPDQSGYDWEVNGVIVGSGSSLSGIFVRGDTVKCVVTPFDGIDAGSPLNASLIIANSLPSISSVGISPSAPVAGDTLICSYATFSDLDGDADSSTVEWFINGLTAGSGASLSSGFSGGDTIMCSVTPFDGTASGGSLSDSVTVANSAPSIASVSINPDPATVTDSLDCSYGGYSDPDGDSDSSTYKWLINGTNAGTGSSLMSGFVKGDTVKCRVTPSDGVLTGSVVSASLNIANTSPVVSSLSLTPSSPSVSDTIHCSYDFFDADGDSDDSTIAWSVAGAAAGTGASISGTFSTGDEVSCAVTPVDDEDTGVPMSVSVIIGNTSPSVSAVTISPAPAYSLDTLSCAYIFDDADGDSDLSTLEWFINGATAGTGITLAGGFTRGDTVMCMVTPNDGAADGLPSSAELVIGNTAPTVSGVIISATTNMDGDGDSATATSADSLECFYTFDDQDGDADSSAIEWTSGVNVLGSGSTLASGFTGGETVYCSVTPNDGSLSGPSLSAQMTIGNSAPTVSGVVVITTTNADVDSNNMTAVVDDTLQCSWAFNDIDGDGDASTVEWFNGGTSLGVGTTLSGAFSKGDPIDCTVTPNDGMDDGVPDSGSIVIDNSIPSVSVLTITPSNPLDTDTLNCSWTFDDADGDLESSTVEWTTASVVVGATTSLTSGFVAGDTVTCAVTPFDGSDAGNVVSDSVTVTRANTAPTVSAVTVVSTTNLDGDSVNTTAIAVDSLLCSWTYADAELDPDVSSVEWFNGSISLGTGTALSGVFAKNETVTCTVTPYDGIDYGLSVSAGITIENAVPSVSAVSIDPVDPFDTDSLTCAWIFFDYDGDSDVSSVEWSVGGSVIGTGHSLSSGYVASDVVTCTVTAFDGADTGIADLSSVTIISSNNPPTEPVISISQPLYTEIDAGLNHSCSLDASGRIDCWGFDGESQLTSTPTSSGYTVLNAGLRHNCAVAASGHLDCWGSDLYNQVSNAPTGTGYTTVTGEGDHNCALTSSGFVECWGRDLHGQVSSTPSGSGYIAVGAGLFHSCAVESSGSISCWGDDYFNQVSNSPSGAGYVELSGGVYHSCALDSTGRITCWGNDDYGQVSNTPVDSGYTMLSGGSYHNCALDAAGGIDCWGYDDFDQVVDAPSGNSYIGVSAGGVHSCALDAIGSIECWGNDDSGEVSAAPLNTRLICEIDTVSSDVDGDSVSYTFEWDVDGFAYTVATTTYYSGDTVPNGAYAAGETWTCTVTPNDGIGDGPAASTSFVVP